MVIRAVALYVGIETLFRIALALERMQAATLDPALNHSQDSERETYGPENVTKGFHGDHLLGI
jgi:hypothetical protein